MAEASDKFEGIGLRTRQSLRSQAIGYGVAVLATVVTTAIAIVIARMTGGYVPPLIYVPGIVLAAAVGGLGPGLVATTLAGLAATYFLLLPIGFAIADPHDFVRLCVLVGVGILVSSLLAVTRRRREDIDEERERLRITLASIGDGVIRTDAMGRVTGLNGVAADLTGWDEAEALGRALTEVFRIVNETTRDSVDNPALRALREGRIVGLANHTLLISKDGTERPIEDSASPIRDAFGRVVGAVLVFRDVTAERRAAKAFRSIDARRAAMLDSALDGIVAIDAGGLVIDFNPAAERIFGYPRSQAVGRDITQFIPPTHRADNALESGAPESLAAALKRGEARILNQRLELTAIRADGSEFPAEISIARASLDDSPIYVGYIRDISERKRAERERTFFVELAAATQPLDDPAELTQTAARLLAEHVGADRCAYAEIEDESIFVITGDYTRDVPSVVGRWPVEDFGAECVRSMLADEAFVVEDSEDDPRIGPQDLPAYRATAIRSLICVPLFKGGQFTAAMAVHQKTVRRWTDHEIAFVRTVVARCWEALQRCRAVRQLRESEERYRSLIAATAAIVWDTPASGEFETPQPSWTEFTGQTFQQFREWGWLDAVHPDDRSETTATWQRALATASQYVVEHRLRRKDGEYRVMSVRGVPILDEAGQVREWVGIHTDVTESKRASAALGASEERYRTLFETMDEGFCVAEVVYDDQGRAVDYLFLEANPAFEKHSGLSNVVGKTAGELVPGHESYWAEIYGEVVRTGKPVRFENEAQMLHRWFDVNAFRIGGEGSVRVAQLFTDITHRKRAEAELRESEERFRRMADDAPVMVWVTDPDGICTYLSKSWYELTGQTPETGLGFGWIDATHPDDQAMARDAFIAANAARGPFRIEYRLRRKDGEYGWFIDAATPRLGANGEYLGYIGSVVDITDRRQAEQLRQEHEARFRTLVEQVEDYAIFMIDREGRSTSWNEGVQRVLGFAEAEFLGTDVTSVIFTPEDQAAGIPERELAEAAATGRSNNDRWMRRKDGTRFYATGVTNSLRDDRDELLGYMKVMRDHTERKQMEDELRRVAADLSEADRRKNEFLATLAHELRNPLAPIRSGLELMRLTGDDPQETAEIRDVMERQAQQMMRLIDDLLEVARITQGKLDLRTATVNLSDIVRSAVDASRPFMEEGGHELIVSIPPEPVRLTADPNRLQQVFSNLLNNAAKYTPDGGKIELLAAIEEGGVAVRVRDDGIGIPPEMKDRIFEMFTQIDRSMERSYSGLGIGLTLVKRLVEMHGGTIEVKSEGRNQGSEFIVRLPTEASRSDTENSEERSDAASTGGLRVLVVDDNRPAADILAKVIRLLGNEARTAYDGREGVAAADDYRPDVILMDLGMPTMNGYEATREIRKADWGGGITIVALTGWGQDEDRRRTEEAGFDRHLVKPVEPATLQKLLAETRKKPTE